jgi:hypothetical protein
LKELLFALSPPIIDLCFGMWLGRFVAARFEAYNTEQWSRELLREAIARAEVIAGHWQFLGLWSIAIIVALLENSQVSRVLIAVTVVGGFALWLYFLTLSWTEIRGWRRRIPLILRVWGYGVPVVIAIIAFRDQS